MTRQVVNWCIATLLCVVAATACDNHDVVAPAEDAEYLQGTSSVTYSPDGEPSDYGDIESVLTTVDDSRVTSITVLVKGDFSSYFKHTVRVEISVDHRIPAVSTQPLTYIGWAKDGHISTLPIGIQCYKAEHTINASTNHEAGFVYKTDKAFSVAVQYHCGPDGSSNDGGGTWEEPGGGDDCPSEYVFVEVWNAEEERWEIIWEGYVEVCEA